MGKSKNLKFDSNHPDTPANRELQGMLYIDLQAAVVAMGMDFNDVVDGDHGKLASWFIRNYEKPRDKGKLEDFDIWVNSILARKYDTEHPLRKYRKFSMMNEDGSVQVTQTAIHGAKIKKTKKSKRSRDSKFGIFTGTAKAYTYMLTKDLIDTLGTKYPTNKELQKKFSVKMVTRVSAKYPDVTSKSIRIWMSRALKATRP